MEGGAGGLQLVLTAGLGDGSASVSSKVSCASGILAMVASEKKWLPSNRMIAVTFGKLPCRQELAEVPHDMVLIVRLD